MSKLKTVISVVLVLLIICGAAIVFFPQIKSLFKPRVTISWVTSSQISFSISQYPTLKKYGYGNPALLSSGVFTAIPNISSTTFAVLTPPMVWNTQGGNILTDLATEYPVTSVLVFNKDASFFKAMPLPKSGNTCCKPVITWLGDRYVMAYQFFPPFTDPQATSSPNVENSFYVGDASASSSKVFEVVPVSGEVMQKDNAEMNFFPNPNNNIVAASYCLNRIQTYGGNYCSRYGFAIATPQRFAEVMAIDTTDATDNFMIGWGDDNNLYIQQSNQSIGTTTMYSFPLTSYENDQFISVLSQHPDPTSKGDPVWIKTLVPVKYPIDEISLDLNFTSTSTYSRGFLTISLDNEVIGVAYEEQEQRGLHHKIFYFNEKPPGSYTLEFRVDPLNLRIKSGTDIENVRLGFVPFGTGTSSTMLNQ